VRLYAALADEREHLRPVVTLALLTGMRKGEILDLRWEHLNLGAEVEQHLIKGETWNLRPGWLLVVKTKSGIPRMIPMSTKVRGLLSVLREHTDSELVFPSGRTGLRVTDIKTGFRTALSRAKLSNFRFHDLRHTWATRAADCHVPEPVRRDIMGHQSETMTGDYIHAMLEAMEEAVELVTSYRGRAAAGPAKSRQGRSTPPASRRNPLIDKGESW
jgi:integrase